jgi:hypothetical protein
VGDFKKTGGTITSLVDKANLDRLILLCIKDFSMWLDPAVDNLMLTVPSPANCYLPLPSIGASLRGL